MRHFHTFIRPPSIKQIIERYIAGISIAKNVDGSHVYPTAANIINALNDPLISIGLSYALYEVGYHSLTSAESILPHIDVPEINNAVAVARETAGLIAADVSGIDTNDLATRIYEQRASAKRAYKVVQSLPQDRDASTVVTAYVASLAGTKNNGAVKYDTAASLFGDSRGATRDHGGLTIALIKAGYNNDIDAAGAINIQNIQNAVKNARDKAGFDNPDSLIVSIQNRVNNREEGYVGLIAELVDDVNRKMPDIKLANAASQFDPATQVRVINPLLAAVKTAATNFSGTQSNDNAKALAAALENALHGAGVPANAIPEANLIPLLKAAIPANIDEFTNKRGQIAATANIDDHGHQNTIERMWNSARDQVAEEHRTLVINTAIRGAIVHDVNAVGIAGGKLTKEQRRTARADAAIAQEEGLGNNLTYVSDTYPNITRDEIIAGIRAIKTSLADDVRISCADIGADSLVNRVLAKQNPLVTAIRVAATDLNNGAPTDVQALALSTAIDKALRGDGVAANAVPANQILPLVKAAIHDTDAGSKRFTALREAAAMENAATGGDNGRQTAVKDLWNNAATDKAIETIVVTETSLGINKVGTEAQNDAARVKKLAARKADLVTALTDPNLLRDGVAINESITRVTANTEASRVAASATAPTLISEIVAELNPLLVAVRDTEIKRQVKETESLKKSLEKLSQISRDPNTRRKLQNHPTEENDGTNYSYEVTEDTNANDVVTYKITRIHKAAPVGAAPAVEIVDDKRMSRIVFEPGKKTKGFLNYSQEYIDTLIQVYEEGGAFYQEGREFKESDLLGDLVSGNAANSNGIGEYEDAVGSIEQGKSQSKASNTVANDGLKTRISGILGRGTFGGVASSKDIEVNNFTIGADTRNYSYKITSSTTRLGGSSFSIERTISELDGTPPVVTHNKLVFEKGKTAVGYVNKANTGDSQLSQITSDDRREYELMLEILDRVNTRDTENKAQLETAAPLVKSLEGLVKKFTKNPQELSRLQILDNGGLVDIDAGTDTYQATKAVVGDVTTYNVIKMHYNKAGAAQPLRNYRLILEPGKKARGFLDKTDAEAADPANVIELTQDAVPGTGILAFLSEVNPVAKGTRKSTLKDQVKATDPLKTSLETLFATYDNEATRHKLQNHEVAVGENYSYEVRRGEVVGVEVSYTIKRTKKGVELNEVVYSKVEFREGGKTKGFLNQGAEDSPLLDLIPGNAPDVGTDTFLAEITKINQGKSAKKDDNKTKNDVLKAKLLTLLDDSRSKNIVVHNPDGTNFTYDISKEISATTGDIFKLVKTENGVETHSKLEFDSKKTARGYVNRGVGDAKNMEPISDDVRGDYIAEIALFAAANLQKQLQDLVGDGESRKVGAVTISRGNDDNGKKRRAFKALDALGGNFDDALDSLKVNLNPEEDAYSNLETARQAIFADPVAFGVADPNANKKAAFNALIDLGGDINNVALFLANGMHPNHANLTEAKNAIPQKEEYFLIRDESKVGQYSKLLFDGDEERVRINKYVGNANEADLMIEIELDEYGFFDFMQQDILSISTRAKTFSTAYNEGVTAQEKDTKRLKKHLENLVEKYGQDSESLTLLQVLNAQGEVEDAGGTNSYKVRKTQEGNKVIYDLEKTNHPHDEGGDVITYSKVILEDGKKAKGFIDVDLAAAQNLHTIDDLGLGEVTGLLTQVKPAAKKPDAKGAAKSLVKLDNKAINDGWIERLSSLVEEPKIGGKTSNQFTVHNPDVVDDNYYYTVTRNKTTGGTLSFSLVGKDEHGVEKYSKLSFKNGEAWGYVNRIEAQAAGFNDDNLPKITLADRAAYDNVIIAFQAANLQSNLQDLVKDGESKELTIGGNAVTISRGDDENGKKRRALTALAALRVYGDSFANLEAELKSNHDGGVAHANLVNASAALNLIDGESAKKTAFSALNALAGGDLDAKMNGLFGIGAANHANIAAVIATIPLKQELFHIEDARNAGVTHATLAFDANNPRKVTALTPDALVRGDAGIPAADKALIKRIAEMSGRVAEYQSQDKAVVKGQSKVSGKLKDSLQKIYEDYQLDNRCLTYLPALNSDGSIVADGKTDSYSMDASIPTFANKGTTTYTIIKTSNDRDGKAVANSKRYSVYAFDREGAVAGFTDKPAEGAGSVNLDDKNAVAAAMKPLDVDKAATQWERALRIDVMNTGNIDPVAMENIQNILNERAAAESQKSAKDKLKDALDKKYKEYDGGGGLQNLPRRGENGAIDSSKGTDTYVVGKDDTTTPGKTIYTITKTHKDLKGRPFLPKYSKYKFDNLRGEVMFFEGKESPAHEMTPLALEKPNLLLGRSSIASVLGKSSLNFDSEIISRVDEISEKRTDSHLRQVGDTGYAFATGASKVATKTAVVVGSIPVVALSAAPLAKPLVKSFGSMLVGGARLIGAGAVGAFYDLPVGIYKTIEKRSFSEGFENSLSPKIIEPSVIAFSERKEEFKEASSSFRGAISKVDGIRKSDKPFVETLEALSGVGTVLSEVAIDGGQKLSAMFKSSEESGSQVISESQKPKVAGVFDSSSRVSDQSENKPIAKKRDIIRSGGKSYEYVGGSWSVVEEENTNKFKSKADRERSESHISITEGAEEGHSRVAKRSERFGAESKAESSNIGDARIAVSEAVYSGQISIKNAAKAKMAVLMGVVESVDELCENKSGELSFGKTLSKKEEAILDLAGPSASTAAVSKKRSVPEVARKRGDDASLDANYVEHRDIAFSNKNDFSKAFMNRFASSTFEGCDLSSVGKNKMTFRHCTFGEGCELPEDLSKIGKNSFVNCKFSEKFLDGLGDRRDEFVERFGLHGGVKDGYLDNSPRSSVKEHEAVNLKQRSAGR